MDKNQNELNDKWEAVFTYLIAGLCISAAIYGIVASENFSFAKWAFGFAVALTGGRDLVKGIVRK